MPLDRVTHGVLEFLRIQGVKNDTWQLPDSVLRTKDPRVADLSKEDLWVILERLEDDDYIDLNREEKTISLLGGGERVTQKVFKRLTFAGPKARPVARGYVPSSFWRAGH